ncbi:MAG TPA: GTPase [Telluria sp.]|nr:GTPase [Telluria sp.]
MITATLVAGGTPAERERRIAADLAPGIPTALILEGIPTGNPILDPSPTLHLHRLAPGCLCCTGNLVLRVTLNRVLRTPVQRLYIGLASAAHVDQLRSWLSLTPYDQLLELGPDLEA